MAEQNPQHGRRQHFHRGRRGNDRRGNERRPNPSSPPAEQSGGRDHVDVEQIMREIRSRISQRHGIELSTQQIQELAARRLEAILDPRTMKPPLLEQIRRSTSTPLDAPSTPDQTYTFEDTTLYETPRGFLRFMRRLLNPVLKLFFNPGPLITALNTQAKLNQAVTQREAERDRRQAEWNALHYEILQRLVLEVTRTSLEAQQLSMRIEALSAKVDFAERRARSLEGSLHQARPAPPRHVDAPPAQQQAAQQPREASGDVTSGGAVAADGTTGEGARRRRRRRRGRRPQGLTPEGAVIGGVAGAALPDSTPAFEGADPLDDEGDEDDGGPDNGGDDGDIIATTPAPAFTPDPVALSQPAAPQQEMSPETSVAPENVPTVSDPAAPEETPPPDRQGPHGE
jgi:hypothetical protein